jgi:hypothetical protein
MANALSAILSIVARAASSRPAVPILGAALFELLRGFPRQSVAQKPAHLAFLAPLQLPPLRA